MLLTSWKKIALYGFLIWLIPFMAGFLLFPLHTSNRIFFESIMPVVLAVCTVVFGILYFKKINFSMASKEGLVVGILWMGISLFFDALFFLVGPFKMGVVAYIEDIGFTYLMILAITWGIGCLLQKKTA